MSKIVILTGAGISAESNIDTFNDKDGLWSKHNIKEVCNYDSLIKNKKKTIAFYDAYRIALENKLPNKTHQVLKELKDNYKNDIFIATQNIDDLFEKAGASSVLHLHGKLTELRCTNCGKIHEANYKKQKKINNGLCLSCNKELRPNVVFYGEKAENYNVLNNQLRDCQLLIIIGTSGKTIDINYLANHSRKVILNNLIKEDNINETLFDKIYYEKSSEAIYKIQEDINKFLKIKG